MTFRVPGFVFAHVKMESKSRLTKTMKSFKLFLLMVQVDHRRRDIEPGNSLWPKAEPCEISNFR